jgi:16S rRNA (adenine1518-N6/adenine1519-N6)-dimethyltransferase
MVKNANLSKDDVVIEVGPGTGFVTKRILEACKELILVEYDPRMVEIIKKKFPVEIANKKIKLYSEDILFFLNKRQSVLPKRYKVISSLPYNIGSAIVRGFLESNNQPELMILLLQREVAQRMAAKGSDRRSILSNAIQYYSKAEIIGDVSPDSFNPPPKVYSSILKLSDIRKQDKDLSKRLFHVIKIGFARPRKTLLNNLVAGFHDIGKTKILKVLEKANIEPTKRPERVSLDQWDKLAKGFK